jgi:endo-1,4-beta-xylanase
MRTATGYVVEASISLLEAGGPATFHGLDYQVNDASAGARTGIRNWADPTGAGYQSTARWGVGQLVAAPEPEPVPELEVEQTSVRAGGHLDVSLSGLPAGTVVVLELQRGDPTSGGNRPRIALGSVTIGDDGTATARLGVPVTAKPGDYQLVALVDGEVVDSAPVQVKKATVASVVTALIRWLLGLFS